jgi:hypothetical protein
MKCVACSKELGTKEVLYTEDKQAYCSNPFTCNDEHPNSVSNIVARSAAVKMFTEDEIRMNFFDMNNIPEDMKNRVIKIATKPQSIRLSQFDIAYYLIALQEQKGLSSLGESVRYCIQLAMDAEPIETRQESPAVTHNDVKVTELSDGIRFVVPVPEIPKTVNVDWDKEKKEKRRK